MSTSFANGAHSRLPQGLLDAMLKGSSEYDIARLVVVQHAHWHLVGRELDYVLLDGLRRRRASSELEATACPCSDTTKCPLERRKRLALCHFQPFLLGATPTTAQPAARRPPHIGGCSRSRRLQPPGTQPPRLFRPRGTRHGRRHYHRDRPAATHGTHRAAIQSQRHPPPPPLPQQLWPSNQPHSLRRHRFVHWHLRPTSATPPPQLCPPPPRLRPPPPQLRPPPPQLRPTNSRPPPPWPNAIFKLAPASQSALRG
jgi:hypothetical protein